jgi:hypothetical protein
MTLPLKVNVFFAFGGGKALRQAGMLRYRGIIKEQQA